MHANSHSAFGFLSSLHSPIMYTSDSPLWQFLWALAKTSRTFSGTNCKCRFELLFLFFTHVYFFTLTLAKLWLTFLLATGRTSFLWCSFVAPCKRGKERTRHCFSSVMDLTNPKNLHTLYSCVCGSESFLPCTADGWTFYWGVIEHRHETGVNEEAVPQSAGALEEMLSTHTWETIWCYTL